MILSATCTEMQVSPRAPILYQGPLDDILEGASAAGYPGVEMHIRDSDSIDRGRLRERLDHYGLSLTSIGTGEAYNRDHLSLTDINPQIRRQAVERIRGHIRTARDYPHAVVILGLIRGKVAACGSRGDYVRNLEESLKACLEEAEKYNVVLGLEMVNRYECDILNQIEEGIELTDRLDSPCLGLQIDTFHMNIEESCLMSAIKKAGPRIVHVHVADSDRWYPGHGHLDFDEVIRGLKEVDYHHAIAVECLCKPDGATAGRKALGALRKWVE